MSTHNILLIGGHGKVAQLLTPMLLKRSWNVTSVIRTQEQAPTIKKLGEGLESKSGKLSVLVQSLADVKSVDQAKKILSDAKPDCVVWTAGAGGKGGAEMTYAIDRDAASHFINASVQTPTVKRFVLISYLASRRKPATWWGADSIKSFHAANEALPTYYEAKIAADEVLYRASRSEEAKERGFAGISLRPGTLTTESAKGISLGKVNAGGKTSREAVAQTTVELLAVEGVGSVWLDLLDGDADVAKEVKRVVDENVDCAEGESIV